MAYLYQYIPMEPETAKRLDEKKALAKAEYDYLEELMRASFRKSLTVSLARIPHK